MKKLVVIPTDGEHEAFVDTLTGHGYSIISDTVGRLGVVRVPDLNITTAIGGFGKAQFAVHTQHLLDAESGWDIAICAGVSGALKSDLAIGDVVVATETVEHDFQTFNDSGRPRFLSAIEALRLLRKSANREWSFDIRFAPIASGDQTIMSIEAAETLMGTTGAIAVGWEGAGGARAAQFGGVPFVEIRAITDHADGNVPANIGLNLPICMQNIADFLVSVSSDQLASK